MILKGSQRGGARALAIHLLNPRDNDHVTVAQIRGFCSENLFGAMAEAHALAYGTRCRQPVFSLSLNPPKDQELAPEILVATADRAETTLGLSGQPRVIVIHEKNGRIHAHAVWSRIDGERMTAINMAFFKRKLAALSKELYLEHGWELPEGHRVNGGKSPLNFTLAEWQQCERLQIDPREIKHVFQRAWAHSDNLASFSHALEASGYFVAKGDKRGIVALDIEGNVFAVARACDVKTKDVRSKLGDGSNLPDVDTVRKRIRGKIFEKAKEWMTDGKGKREAEIAPWRAHVKSMKSQHQAERARLRIRLDERSKSEAIERASRFRRGLGIVMDVLTGRLFALRKQNEREAYEAVLRDRAQREQLLSIQFKERKRLQRQIDEIKERHRRERMQTARQVMAFIRFRSGRSGKDYELEM